MVFLINNNVLWLYSGDIGIYVWRIKKNEVNEIEIDLLLKNKGNLPKKIKEKLQQN